MSSISGVGGGSAWMTQDMRGMHKMPPPNVTEMADKVFSRLDSSGKGYIDQADLQAATQQLTSAAASQDASSDVGKLFSALDPDSSGQVSKQEFSDSLQKMADQLDQQRQSSRMENAIAEAGLGGQAGAAGAQGMGGGSKPSNGVRSFEAADLNQDGKVSAEEARAYQQTQASQSMEQAGGSTSNQAGTAATDSSLSPAQVLMQVSRLFQAYVVNHDSGSQASLSVSA
ncbi:EF-hand domain-containing protein [Malikia sp.]|uniref:EF-hand domain-containing protein n=1 Tax=Malikia sp. TaxID=2070706 RepID=UPI002611B072|nr:EF-hand domain-containing protein [Malikia sp.]MDD2729840.1 EF-hand domain-containing protein [Malikia sp.]